MASDDVLIDSYFKTERAKRHLDELRTAIADFLADDPVAVSIEEDTEKQERRYRAVFKQPHVWTYLIAGDIFQCLRTALDQAVWWFASKDYADPAWTQFPIFAEDNAKTRETFARYTKGVPDKAAAVIESLQPYNRPAGTPLFDNLLWQLHEINRIDKHRRISVRATAARIDTCFSPSIAPIENGCEVAVPYGLGSEFEPEFVPLIMFGDRLTGITMQIHGIERMYELVAHGILPRLAGCVSPSAA
jgi:hypothetical protein